MNIINRDLAMLELEHRYEAWKSLPPDPEKQVTQS
jgi:hypothetical protein